MTQPPRKKIADFRVHQVTPGISVIVSPDSPVFTVVSVSDDFVSATGLDRSQVIGQSHFKFFPPSPKDPDFTGEKSLRSSFDKVIRERRRHEMDVQRYHMPVGDDFAVKYCRVKNAPILDEQSGEVLYIVHSVEDTTETVLADQKIEAGKDIERAYEFFIQAPVIIGFVTGEKYEIEFANDPLLKVWKVTNEVIGRSLFEVFPELLTQGFKNLLDNVRITGKPYVAYEFPITFEREGRHDTSYFDFIYQPFYRNHEKVASGVISIGHDVTEKVNAKQKFKNVIEQANDPILIFKGDDMVLEAANQALLKFWKVDESAIGKAFLDILPEMKGQGFMELLRQVLHNGETIQRLQVPAVFAEKDGTSRTAYTNFTYQPYREANGEISGVIVLASDVTDQVLARTRFEESQRKWKDLANSMPVMVWTAGPNGEVNFLNDRWYEFTGLTPEQSLGSGWIQVVHRDDLDRSKKAWTEAVKKQIFYELELRYRRRDGDYIWCIARGLPILENGKVTTWYGTSTEIQKHKQVESQLEDLVRERTKELEEKNVLLDNILKNSSNGISVSQLIFDDENNVTDAQTILANDAAVNFIGLPREQYLSRPASYFDPNIMRSAYGQACVKTARTGEPFIMQYFLEFSGRWLELTVSRMDESHLIHNFTDVTPIKEAQLKLEKSLEDLRFSNANLEEFAYAASHDLKEPIRKFQFFSNRLKEELRDRLQPEQLNLFQRLESTSSRMQHLVDDLLEYSQAAKGGAQDRDELNLHAVIESVLQDLELEIAKRQAVIVFDDLPTISGSKRQMHQLFQNLISNALKYSKPETSPRIEISSKDVRGADVLADLPAETRDKYYHLIEVRDNGIGFNQKDSEKIFKVFTRLHADLDRRGSGVGLSIVKKVVEAHEGIVWAVSEPGKGATFKILLPVALVHR